MAIINIVSFVMIAFAAGYLLKQPLSDMLPFVWCGLICVLFMLSFSRHLSFIDIIMPLCAVALFVCAFSYEKRTGEGSPQFVLYAKDNVLSAPFIVYVLLTVMVSILVRDRVATWWDDVNFWASDLKSIYYIDGFAMKFTNVSPEFGDYPPGTQLAKWFVLHMNPNEYEEGLAFIGYYLFGLSFLMPLFKSIKKKNIWLSIPLTFVCLLFAGIVDKFGYEGFCADLIMAYIFGGILIAAFDKHEDNALFDFLRISLYLGVLVICKSTGIIWAIFGIVIYCMVAILDMTDVTLSKAVKQFTVILCPALMGGAWLLLCVAGHRVAKATSTAIVYMTSNRYALSDYKSELASAFIKAFFVEPLHVDKTFIYLSPAAFMLLIIILLVVFYKKGIIEGRKGKFVSVALPLMGLSYYVFIFIAHITVFSTETQYLESEVMVASIERYGLPFMLGSMMLISYLFLNSRKTNDNMSENEYIRVIVFCVVVVLLSNIPAAYEGFVGYRSHLEEDINSATEFLDYNANLFIDVVKAQLPNGNVRVCRIEDYSNHRVKDVYVGYEVSPVSVMNLSMDLTQIDVGTMIQQIASTRATYLYVDKQDGDINVLDECVPDGTFEYGKLYRISYEAGGMVLYE